jgi:NAD(P)-dependent dehydrogenase (short-subunit alcohol dehydrogenase family)
MAARLTDKVALVFGAGSSGPGWGNGKATAVLFAREGAQVVAVDFNEAAARETAAIIESEGGRALALAGDVTRSDAVEAIVARTARDFGRIDILHNNVGVVERGGLAETTEASWRRVLDTNLTSMFLTCKHALPVMLAQRAGAIVNISSIAGVRYVGDAIGYAASKGGVNQFTMTVAMQYAAHGIRANAIMPGLMDTPMIYGQVAAPGSDPAAVAAARHARCPMGFMGTGWDVAHAAVFLASDEARYITGVCLPVDGGVSCAMWR